MLCWSLLATIAAMLSGQLLLPFSPPSLFPPLLLFLHCIIIIILGISFMQGIYTYIPETNHVHREHCVATILVSLFMVRISLVPALTPLYLYVSTFRSMCAVRNMAVFCSSLTS